MRIVSFLPAATEMVCALGLEDQLVGVTHECDFPASVRSKPVVVRCAMDLSALSPAEIDRVVSERLRSGQSLYEVDLNVLKEVRPDLILTQHLCEVCAPSKPEIVTALEHLPQPPRVCYLSPHSLNDIWQNIREIGEITNRAHEAERLIADGRKRLDHLRTQVAGYPKPKVFFMEWVDPVFNGGHWVSELIEIAGGQDGLANPGKDSVRIPWERVLEYQPEVIIVSPCGYDAKTAQQQVKLLESRSGWNDLPAVRQGRVHAVDANAYFARPGLRVVEGAELLASFFQPSSVALTTFRQM